MNYTSYIKILLKGITVSVAMFLLSVSCANAEPSVQNLEVVFDPAPPAPLFNQLNFLPGDSSSGTITVTNNSGEPQKIITEAISGTDPDGLGSVLNLRIFEEGVSDYYDNTLGYFLSSAGEVDLSPNLDLSSGETAIYTYEVTFGANAEDYQNTTLGFDICIGFFDMAGRVCGDTVIGDEDGEIEDGGTVIPGSGGGGGGLLSLIISNESATVGVDNVVVPPNNGIAIIEWDTNFLSTSQVIYGLATDDYSLNVNTLPYFGYPMGTDEDKIKVTSHSVLLEGLVNGEIYKYRVVSRASPPTISYEHTFLVEMEVGELLDDEGEDPNLPMADGQDSDLFAYADDPAMMDGQTAGGAQGGGSTGGSGTSSGTEEEGGSVSGTAGADPDQTGSEPEEEVEPSRNLASALSAFLENNLSVGKIISILLLLLLLFIIWRVLSKRSKSKE